MIVLVSTSSIPNVSTMHYPFFPEEFYGRGIELRRLLQLLAIALLYANDGSAFVEAF